MAQQLLHSNIFGGSGWRTELLGRHPANYAVPDSAFQLVAYTEDSAACKEDTQLAISAYQVGKHAVACPGLACVLYVIDCVVQLNSVRDGVAGSAAGA